MTNARYSAKQLAAAERRKLAGISDQKEPATGLASIRATKVNDEMEELKRRKANRQKTKNIMNWVQNVDAATRKNNWAKTTNWTKITANELHKFVPFRTQW